MLTPGVLKPLLNRLHGLDGWHAESVQAVVIVSPNAALFWPMQACNTWSVFWGVKQERLAAMSHVLHIAYV